MEINKLVMSIKKRPLMYVKEEKIEYIYYLLSGYCSANTQEDVMDKKFIMWFGKWLNQWIEEHMDSDHISESCFWYDNIKIITKDESAECEVFYNLASLFFEEYNKKSGYFEWLR